MLKAKKCRKKFAYLLTAFTTALIADGALARALHPGESLTIGQSITSDNNAYIAILQSDGNLVVYHNNGSNRAVWSTRTAGRGVVRATLQHDGDFALYDAAGRNVWRAKSNGPNRVAAVSEYGQLSIFEIRDWWTSRTDDERFRQQGALIFPHGFVFQKGATYTEGMYSLSFQHDGNMVLRRHGNPIWISNTLGATEARVGFGLLISGPSVDFKMKAKLKPPRGPGPWSQLSTTLGSVAVFPNGNLVAYHAVRVWSSPQDWAMFPPQ